MHDAEHWQQANAMRHFCRQCRGVSLRYKVMGTIEVKTHRSILAGARWVVNLTTTVPLHCYKCGAVHDVAGKSFSQALPCAFGCSAVSDAGLRGWILSCYAS